MRDSTKWIYFWMAFLLSTLEFGLVFSFGALFSAIRDTFQTDRPTTATVQSLFMGTASCFCAVSGVLINKFGLFVVILLSSISVSLGFAVSYFVTDIWYLLASISILSGIGVSMIYISSITLISVIFNGKQKALCIAIQGACVPAAGLFYPYLLDLLNSTYGLKGTFLVLSGLFCNSFVFTLIMWYRRADITLHKETFSAQKETHFDNITDDRPPEKEPFYVIVIFFIKGLMTKRYVCLLIGTVICVATSNGFLGIIFDVSQSKGFDNSEAKMVFVIYNVFGIVFCITPGILKQILEIDTFFYPFGLAVVALFGSLIIRYANAYVMFAVGVAFMSAVPGLLASAFMICAQLVHQKQVSVAIGLFDTVIGFLSAGAGPIYGFIRDNSGSYDHVFPIIAAVQGLGALLFIGDIISRKLTQNAPSNNNDFE